MQVLLQAQTSLPMTMLLPMTLLYGHHCRSGLVISIAEPDTLFVIKKMAKRLQIAIAKAAVSEGVLALDEQEGGKGPAAIKQVAAE